MDRKVFVWSVPDEGGMINERIEYMLKNGWAGQGWSDINFSELSNEEEFSNVHKKVYKEVARDRAITTFKYLKQMREGNIVVLKSGAVPYAVGIVKSPLIYREDLLNLDIANGVYVDWIIHNNGHPLADFPKFNKARTLGIEQTKDLKDFYIKKVQEVLNARKFRGED